MDWERSAVHTTVGMRGFYTIRTVAQRATLVFNEWTGEKYGEPETLAKDISLAKAKKLAAEHDAKVPVAAN